MERTTTALVTKDSTSIEIRPVGGPINLTIRTPGSKSLTNRALVCAALTSGRSTLTGVLDSDDTRVLISALKQLGVEVVHDKSKCEIQIEGCKGVFHSPDADLDVENSGTTIRFLTAALATAGGKYRLVGIERMHQRPIGALLDALTELGAKVTAESPGDCPPVRIDNTRLEGGSVSIKGDISSQYLSGLMMAAPIAKSGMKIAVLGELVSKPYVEMTRSVMRSFGADCVVATDFSSVTVKPQQSYQSTTYAIEPDASAASYFLAAAAICGGSATVEGLNRNTLQGDVRFAEVLQKMGCKADYQHDSITVTGPAKSGVDVDMSDISDTVQSLAAVALFVDGKTTVRGVAHNRVKETDRISDLARELRKVNANVSEFEDGLVIEPAVTCAATFETYNDHRMAMSLALVGLRQPGIVILNPGCVSKTYPNFFDDLSRVYG